MRTPVGKKVFLIDVARCTGCNLCVIACKDEHVGNSYPPWTAPQPEIGHFWIAVQTAEKGRTPRVKVDHLPLLCQHCENAACMKVCPESAIKRRDDALVWIDPAVCTGCGLCREACPYGVIYLNTDRKIAQKCTGCAHRVDEGLLPRCADICPHQAILVGDEQDEAFGAALQDPAWEVFHPEYKAQPRVYWRGIPRPHIAGCVVDAAGDEVLSGAEVTTTDLVDGTTVSVLTDAFGDFWIPDVEEGRKYRVAVTKNGYQAWVAVVTVKGSQDLGDVRLSPSS